MKKILALCVLALVLGQAQGALIVSESFDYAVGTPLASGTPLVGLTGGYGWSTTAPAAPGGWVLNSYTTPINTIGDGLTSSFLGCTSGGSLTMNGKDNYATSRAFTAFSDNTSTNTTWFSFLLDVTGTAAINGGRVKFEAYNSTSKGYGIQFNTTAPAEGSVTYTVWAMAGSTSVAATSTITTSDTLLVLGKSVKNGAGSATVEIWLNPVDPINLGTANATATGNLGSPNYGGITLKNVAASTGAVYAVDQIKLGDTMADVIPEPATLALLGLGAIALRIGKKR
jgi:hypothetical protein